MKKLLTILLLSFIFLFTTKNCVFAENNPLSTDNNKFGIHITNEKDLQDAANLVNSSGGDWGYVTFVITEGERDRDRWQKVFDQMRRLHLIPIIRVATKADGDNWEIPKTEEIDSWVSFFNSLNWVIQNRYIIIGNEPNHATEWGGKIDPAAYADYLNDFATKLHEGSTDYFVLQAGFDASAKKTSTTMDEALFISKMLAKDPDVFDKIDGWTSHSYPNPDFSGNPTDIGRGSINTFSWEFSYLKSIGVAKDFPVFITETGWSNKNIDSDQIGKNYEYAFSNIWNDKRVVAVTPFILNYPNAPFSQFSWKKADGSFYTYFNIYKNISKEKGKPTQIESGQILGAIAQPIIVSGSDFVGAVLAKNNGQSIWKNDNTSLMGDSLDISFSSSLLFDIEPTRTGLIVFRASTSEQKGVLLRSLYLSDSLGKRVTNSFPIEGVFVSVDKARVNDFLGKIFEHFKSLVKI